MTAVTISQAHKKIVFPWHDPEPVAQIIPDTKSIMRDGKKFGVVDHGIAETKLLRNMGFSVPAPIRYQYDWAGGTPYESQIDTAAMLSTEQRAYCLSSMGVGKTRAILYAYDYLKSVGLVDKMLVVAPLSTLVDVWDREIFECFHHLNAITLHGTKKQRLKALAEDVDVYIINHDGVGVVLDELMQRKWGVVAIDELAVLRNPTTTRWKVMNKLINRKEQVARPSFVWGATGGPTPNGPPDAYGQVKLLTPSRVPRTARAFQQQTMYQVSQFRWIPRNEAQAIVHEAMQPSVRFTLDQCHDIPPQTFSSRHVPMSPKQALVYNAVLKKFRAQWDGNDIVAVNEGAKIAKLLQISCGFAYSEDKGMYLDAKARINEVLALIEQADQKVLVFAAFKWVVKALHTVIDKKFPAAMITGDTPKKERDQIFAEFRRSKNPHVIVAHAGTMAHGLTLVEADTIIWYGPTMSNEIVEQANARIRRAGQTRRTHIICIESTPVERKAFKRLQNNQKMQGLLLDMFEGVNEGD